MKVLPTFISFLNIKSNTYVKALLINMACLLLISLFGISHHTKSSSLTSPLSQLKPLKESKNDKEIFGFAPYWTFNKLDTVDFEVLTTLAYFGIDVDENGNLDTEGNGYKTFMSSHATDVFTKAHQHNTRVVLTVTQMDNEKIRTFLDDPKAQKHMIAQTVDMVKKRGIDGVNVDFEYSGNPGQDYRDAFSTFMQDLITAMHSEIPQSKITISVYASAIKSPKIYDIAALGKQDLQIFMMAYDFGYRGSDQVIPTSPLYGHKEGKYWYDVSTAVEDFLAYMPAEKLILGTPWYGYNYAIYGSPKIKANTKPSWSWGNAPAAQTYAIAQKNISANMKGITNYKEGWDDLGKVAWKAYYKADTKTWRMLFVDDQRSLSYKYDFAKEKNLGGIGIWALGFDDGNGELWNHLAKAFGPKKYADSRLANKPITNL